MRTGTSITNATMSAMLPAVKTAVQRDHVTALKEEAQLGGARANEARENAELGIDNYNMRPTKASDHYCGLEEFAGRYYICAVKNGDGNCPDFGARQSGVRSCVTCAHLVRPSPNAFSAIERCAQTLREAGALIQRIRSTLEDRAPVEYQSCVLGAEAGVLSTQPAFLPWCRAWSDDRAIDSSASRFVVGPVVNVGNDCPRWEPAGDSKTPEETELERRIAQWIGQSNVGIRGGGALEIGLWAIRWTAVELISYCLFLLGSDISFITSVSESILRDNPPFIGGGDEEMIQTLHQMSQTGSATPTYLKNMAPYQQWLARQEPPAAEFPLSKDGIDIESFNPQQREQIYELYEKTFHQWQSGDPRFATALQSATRARAYHSWLAERKQQGPATPKIKVALSPRAETLSAGALQSRVREAPLTPGLVPPMDLGTLARALTVLVRQEPPASPEVMPSRQKPSAAQFPVVGDDPESTAYPPELRAEVYDIHEFLYRRWQTGDPLAASKMPGMTRTQAYHRWLAQRESQRPFTPADVAPHQSPVLREPLAAEFPLEGTGVESLGFMERARLYKLHEDLYCLWQTDNPYVTSLLPSMTRSRVYHWWLEIRILLVKCKDFPYLRYHHCEQLEKIKDPEERVKQAIVFQRQDAEWVVDTLLKKRKEQSSGDKLREDLAKNMRA